jgi:transposase InsO family protein
LLKYHKAEKDTDIVNNVINLQLETGYRVGILKTQALLAKKGIAVGHNRLARIMSENSLNPKFNRKRYPPEYYAQKNASQKNQERENVLNRQFDAKRPGEKLVTDITYIKVAEGWLYLSAVIDLFNSDVVAFVISNQLNVDFALKTLKALSDNGHVPQKACIFHSDQGFTYTHERFVEALKTQGFRQSFSRVGNCWDNACAESFFGHLKAELGITHQKKVLSYAEMERKIKNYIEYYRTKRVQARLAYRTPHEVMLDYQAALN